jgi:hypothetical protein
MVKTITAKMPHSGKGFEMNKTTIIVEPKQKRDYGDILLNLFGFIGNMAVKR